MIIFRIMTVGGEVKSPRKIHGGKKASQLKTVGVSDKSLFFT